MSRNLIAATPTECFAAVRAGADGIKLFPAAQIGPKGLDAISAVLPTGTKLSAVGGADVSSFSDWAAAGASGFGLGTAPFRPGDSTHTIYDRAIEMVRNTTKFFNVD